MTQNCYAKHTFLNLYIQQSTVVFKTSTEIRYQSVIFLTVIKQSFLAPEFIALHSMYKYIFTYNSSCCYLFLCCYSLNFAFFSFSF